jgi:hypothetical protein
MSAPNTTVPGVSWKSNGSALLEVHPNLTAKLNTVTFADYSTRSVNARGGVGGGPMLAHWVPVSRDNTFSVCFEGMHPNGRLEHHSTQVQMYPCDALFHDGEEYVKLICLNQLLLTYVQYIRRRH